MVKLTEIKKEELLNQLKKMIEKDYNSLQMITAIDRNDHIEVVYLLYSYKHNKHQTFNIKLNSEKPEIDSVMVLYKSADWYERELSEMFGIKIKGRKIKRLLLEEWNGVSYPLRKDYVWGSTYKVR